MEYPATGSRSCLLLGDPGARMDLPRPATRNLEYTPPPPSAVAHMPEPETGTCCRTELRLPSRVAVEVDTVSTRTIRMPRRTRKKKTPFSDLDSCLPLLLESPGHDVLLGAPYGHSGSESDVGHPPPPPLSRRLGAQAPRAASGGRHRRRPSGRRRWRHAAEQKSDLFAVSPLSSFFPPSSLLAGFGFSRAGSVFASLKCSRAVALPSWLVGRVDILPSLLHYKPLHLKAAVYFNKFSS
jgi:hypothetical protein